MVGVDDTVGVGDTVEITECRPLSKRKCFKVSQVLKRVPRVSDLAEEGAIAGVMKHRKKEEQETKETDETKDSRTHSSTDK